MRDEPEFRDGFLSTAEGVSPFVCGWLSKFSCVLFTRPGAQVQ